MEKIIELAKKLKALSDRGIGGEKENADAMLKSLMDKHSLSEELISGDVLREFHFTIKEHQQLLFSAIVGNVNRDIKVYGPFPSEVIEQYRLDGNFMINCTPAEYIEIEAKNNLFQRLYKEETDMFRIAFIQANNLFPKDSKPTNIDEAPLSNEEYMEALRIIEVSEKIKKGQYYKQVNNR